MTEECGIEPLENSFEEIKRLINTGQGIHVDFNDEFSTAKGNYKIEILCEPFGAYINDDWTIELHTRILEGRGLPKQQDNDLISQIHDRIIEEMSLAADIDPDQVMVVPHIDFDKIQYADDDDSMGPLEAEILELCSKHDLEIDDVADLLDMMLDKLVNFLSMKNDAETSKLDSIIEHKFARKIEQSKQEELNYIQ